MAITITALHENRVVEQLIRNLVQLQIDIVRNATTWKGMAQAQNPALPTLQSYVNDAVFQYRRRLQWVTDFRADAGKRARLQAALQRIGIAQADVVAQVTELVAAINAFDALNRSSYAQIITACDAVLASVEAPLSLWPE